MADICNLTFPSRKIRVVAEEFHMGSSLIGSVVAIYVAPAAREPMRSVKRILAIAGRGLEGDRYSFGQGSYNQNSPGNRQVTFIDARHFHGSGYEHSESRRNIITANFELMAQIDREFRCGAARFRGVKYCKPCKVPGELAGKETNFAEVFHERGGLIAEVLDGGPIQVGHLMFPL